MITRFYHDPLSKKNHFVLVGKLYFSFNSFEPTRSGRRASARINSASEN